MWMVDWCPQLALEVIEAWGFAHKTTAFTWAKENGSGEGWHMGNGYWTRANPKDCWLATRGPPETHQRRRAATHRRPGDGALAQA
jgi:N6-adenosine-specific RNA methylase IME4